MSELNQIFFQEVMSNDFLELLNNTDPCIIYNLRLLDNLTKYLRSRADDAGVKMLYSIKANRNPEILNTLEHNVYGYDCASDKELETVLKLKKTNISVTGLNWSVEQMEKLNPRLITFYANSEVQLLEYIKLFPQAQLGIRIQSDSNQFGIGVDSRIWYSQVKNKIVRLHCHGLTTKQIIEFAEKISCFIDLKNIQEINLGGSSLAYEVLMGNPQTMAFLRKLRSLFLNASIIVEPGQMMVNFAGFLVTKVIDKRQSGITLSNSAFNLSSWYPPKLLLPNLQKGTDFIWGSSNFGEDIFMEDVNTSSVQLGDKLIFSMVGAYFKTTHRELHGEQFPIEKYWEGPANG